MVETDLAKRTILGSLDAGLVLFGLAWPLCLLLVQQQQSYGALPPFWDSGFAAHQMGNGLKSGCGKSQSNDERVET